MNFTHLENPAVAFEGEVKRSIGSLIVIEDLRNGAVADEVDRSSPRGILADLGQIVGTPKFWHFVVDVLCYRGKI